MRNRLSFLALMLVGCGGSQASGGGAQASAAPTGDTFSGEGISLTRPGDWKFVAADPSVAPDTLVIVQGPPGNEDVAPVLEVSRRKLTAMDQRKRPATILSTVVAEMSQLFEGFEMVSQPEDVQVDGINASRLGLKYSESMPDGSSVQRAGRFYGVVRGDTLWLLRCIGPVDGSAEDSCNRIVSSVEFDT